MTILDPFISLIIIAIMYGLPTASYSGPYFPEVKISAMMDHLFSFCSGCQNNFCGVVIVVNLFDDNLKVSKSSSDIFSFLVCAMAIFLTKLR